MRFETKRIAAEPDAIAPDGSEVRVLCRASRGGLALFTLPPRAVSKAVAHHTVEEVWYIISGKGRMWRKQGDQEEIAELGPACRLRYRPARIFNSAATGPSPSTRSAPRCRPGRARAKPSSSTEPGSPRCNRNRRGNSSTGTQAARDSKFLAPYGGPALRRNQASRMDREQRAERRE